MHTPTSTSTHALLLTGVVPPVCDAEAGQEHGSDYERVEQSASTGSSSGTSDIGQEDSERAKSLSTEHEVSVRSLRSLMIELCTAIRGALDNERGSAEDSLRRATEMLEALGGREVSAVQQMRGGLSPWQVRKVMSYVETHLDRPIRNEDLASLVRLNASHFGRAFRNSFGEPPHEYVIRRRVERAQGLMLSTDASLSEIALDCGLADQSHLTRLFRRIEGESPRAWRRARLAAPA